MRQLLVISLLAVAAGAGCSRPRDDGAARAVTVPTVSVDELDHLLASGASQAVDANGSLTRQKMGVIPGAVLLRDYASTEGLPSDKSRGLVFYCANPACSASHEAARKAIAAGYRDVKVMPDGIAGWVKAGKKTQAL